MSVFDESKALHDAARSCGFDGHTIELCHKNDAITRADQMVVCHKLPVFVKRSYLYLDRLDATFFYDQNGRPTCSFAGLVSNQSNDYDNMADMVMRMTSMLDAMEEARGRALEREVTHHD